MNMKVYDNNEEATIYLYLREDSKGNIVLSARNIGFHLYDILSISKNGIWKHNLEGFQKSVPFTLVKNTKNENHINIEN